MPDFYAKMHQNQFRLGLRPRPRWGSLQRSLRPIAGFKGPTSKGRGGRRGVARGGEESGRSTCLPPRFDTPGYGPGMGGG